MRRLVSTLEHAVRVVAIASRAPAEALTGREDVLPELARLLDADTAAWWERDRRTGAARCAAHPAAAWPADQALVDAVARTHPLIDGLAGRGAVARLCDLVPSGRELHRDYRHHLAMLGVRHQLGGCVRFDAGTVAVVVLGRAGREFSATDVGVLSVVLPYLPCGATPQGDLPLSPREREVLDLAARGRTNEAIAHALAISPGTVAKHLEHSYRKLGVSGRAAAATRLAQAPVRLPEPL